MGIRRIRDEQGQPISDLRPGDNPIKAVDAIYKYGRRFPRNDRTQADYESPGRAPPNRARQPRMEEYSASYGMIKNSNVSPAPDESANQFRDGKVADHVDVPVSAWTRSGTHPHFDRRVSGEASHKYRK